MGELYKSNKDELIQIILAVKENISTEELKKELNRREELENLYQLKRSLLNLKVIPHLEKFIEKHEPFIINMKERRDMQRLYIELRSVGIFGDDRRDLYRDIMTNATWVKSDKIDYLPCKLCNNFEILLYKDRILQSVEICLSDGFGTEYTPQFINSICPECQ